MTLTGNAGANASSAAVRKSLNAEWTKDNAKVIRKINQAIDKDIASAGGGDLLKKADSIHQMEKTIFGSKGIKDVFGEIDSNGVETGKVAFDKLSDRLNEMSFNQWKHIYDTADKLSKGEMRGPVDPKTGEPRWVLQVPPELQTSAQSVKSEMLGGIAREIYQQGASKEGVWNQNSANKRMNARQDKIKYAFSPEEQKAFHTLNVAGYLMPGVHGYEGSALQKRRLGIIESRLPQAGATVGGAIGTYFGGPTVGVAGALGGERIGEKLQARSIAKKEAKEAKKLQKEMQKTSKLSEMLPKEKK